MICELNKPSCYQMFHGDDYIIATAFYRAINEKMIITLTQKCNNVTTTKNIRIINATWDNEENILTWKEYDGIENIINYNTYTLEYMKTNTDTFTFQDMNNNITFEIPLVKLFNFS